MGDENIEVNYEKQSIPPSKHLKSKEIKIGCEILSNLLKKIFSMSFFVYHSSIEK